MTEDEQREFDAMKEKLAGFQASYQKLQEGWDAEIATHNATKAANAEAVQLLKESHAAEIASIRSANAVALLKEKQRVDRLEFDAKQAAELAQLQ